MVFNVVRETFTLNALAIGFSARIEDHAASPTFTGIQISAGLQTSFLSLLYLLYSVVYQDSFVVATCHP